jgi:hypothetical protein
MTEKKKEPHHHEDKPTSSSYTMRDVLKITDDIFQLSKEKKYNTGAFVHGLIFSLEFAQQSYHIPPQQLAEIKRDCRQYVDEIIRANAQATPAEEKKEQAPKET